MNILSFFRVFFWALLLAVLVVALLPPNDAPSFFVLDKLNHILAFFALSSIARVLWPRRSIALLFTLLIVFGGSIELLQSLMPFGRTAEWMDFGADVIAILLGLLVGQLILGLKKLRPASNA